MPNIRIVVNGNNKFDNQGNSLDQFNSTETDIYVNGIKQSEKRIGGTEYRKLENIGKSFKGEVDGLGFYSIVK